MNTKCKEISNIADIDFKIIVVFILAVLYISKYEQ